MEAGQLRLVFADAYGGSVISNGLTGTSSSSPASDDQVALYLAALAKGSIKPGTGRVLHYFNTGINPVAQIWLNAVWAGMGEAAKANATAAITSNVQSLGTTILSIDSNAAVAKLHGADYLLVGIPPLEIVPT